MLTPISRLHLSERLAKIAVALGSVAIGITVFLVLNYAVLGLPTVVFGGQEVMLTTGFLLYVGVRVAGIAVAALFYLYFGNALANILRRKIVSWKQLILIITGIAAALYAWFILS
jgi:hypothetical protein